MTPRPHLQAAAIVAWSTHGPHENGDGWLSQLYPLHRKWSKKQVTMPQERRPTGICPGTGSHQHPHLWPVNHHLGKVCICWRPCNHACRWRSTGSGRGAEQGHGNDRWIPPDVEAKAQHRENGVGSLPSQQQGRWAELKVNFNNETLPFCSEPKFLGVTLGRSFTYHWHLESLRKKLTSYVALLRRLAGSDSGAGATTLRIASLALVHATAEYCVPVWCAVLIPALSTPPSTTTCELWLDVCVLHQWTTFSSSQTSNLLSFVAVESHCL